MSTGDLFGGTGDYFNYTTKFKCPGVPMRMKNAISAELNHHVYGSSVFLPIPDGVNCREIIPCWLVVLWAEMDLLMRLPNIGKGTYNQTLKAIAHCLSN